MKIFISQDGYNKIELSCNSITAVASLHDALELVETLRPYCEKRTEISIEPFVFAVEEDEQ